jgi:nucleoside-diphosphate-sugar epimerase
MSAVRKLCVFGGNGFVGQAIVKYALAAFPDLQVIGISRSGVKDTMHDLDSSNARLQWMKGDIAALMNDDASTAGSETPNAVAQEWMKEIDSTTGVISCVGMFATSNDVMRQMNGDANRALIETVKNAGAAHMVYVSAYEVEKHLPFKVIPGYFEGKRIAERAVHEHFGSKGTILQPGMVYGTRVQGGAKIPLGVIGKPLEALFTAPLLNQLQHSIPYIGKLAFSPPVSVHDVAKAAVRAATGTRPLPTEAAEKGGEEGVGGAFVMDIEKIRKGD